MTFDGLHHLLKMTVLDLRAAEGGLYLIQDDDHPVRAVHVSPLGGESLLPLEDDPLIRRVIDRAGPVIENDLAATLIVDKSARYASFLGLPLTGSLGALLGVMALASESHVDWTNAELERARTLAGVMANIIDLDNRLSHLERRLQGERSARQTRTSLQRIAAKAASAESPDDLIGVLVNGLGDVFPSDLVVAGLRTDTGVRFVHGPGVPDAVAARWPEASIDAEVPIVRSVQTGETFELADRDAVSRWPLLAIETAELGIEGFASYPILDSNGKPIAALGVGTTNRFELEQTNRLVLEELLSTTGRALERAMGSHRTALAFRDLQRSLLPPATPTLEWLDIATLYRPAADGTRVGGDWYDVVESGFDTVDLVVGDVAGHDIQSAAAMGQVRHVLASFLQSGNDPVTALANTDRYFTARRAQLMATVLVLRLHGSSSSIEISSAGHPPPVLITPDDVQYLDVRPGGPIGAGFGGYNHRTFELDPGDIVAAFTDGVYEHRGGTVDDDLDRLRTDLSTVSRTTNAVSAALGRAAASVDVDDDAAAIVASLRKN